MIDQFFGCLINKWSGWPIFHLSQNYFLSRVKKWRWQFNFSFWFYFFSSCLNFNPNLSSSLILNMLQVTQFLKCSAICLHLKRCFKLWYWFTTFQATNCLILTLHLYWFGAKRGAIRVSKIPPFIWYVKSTNNMILSILVFIIYDYMCNHAILSMITYIIWIYWSWTIF
jgi:hypothetical protein